MTEPETQYPDDSAERGWSSTPVDAEAVTAPQSSEVKESEPVEVTVTEPKEAPEPPAKLPAPPNVTLNSIAPMATRPRGNDLQSECEAFLNDVPEGSVVKVKDAEECRVMQECAVRGGRRVQVVQHRRFQGRWKWQIVKEWEGVMNPNTLQRTTREDYA